MREHTTNVDALYRAPQTRIPRFGRPARRGPGAVFTQSSRPGSESRTGQSTIDNPFTRAGYRRMPAGARATIPAHMKPAHTKRNLMLGIALAAIVAGILVAVLSGGGSHGSVAKTASVKGPVTGAASYLGLTPQQVRTTEKSGLSLDQLAAHTPGRSQAGLIRALMAEATASVRARHLPPAQERAELRRLRARLQRIARRARRQHTATLAVAAGYLGVSEAELIKRLQAEHTLSAVAGSTAGHSAAGLVAALVARRAEVIELAVRQREITPADAKKTLSVLHARMTEAVDRKLL